MFVETKLNLWSTFDFFSSLLHLSHMCGGMDIGGCPSFREEGPPPLRCRTGPPLPPLPRGYGPTPRVEAPRKVIFPPFRLLKTVTFFCPKKYPMWHFFCQISRVFSPALHSHWTKNQPFWQFHCSKGLPPSLTRWSIQPPSPLWFRFMSALILFPKQLILFPK